MKRGPTQAGAALLVAMLTVTVVASFATAALWQQWRSIEVESADRARMQTAWVLNGALDWARLILREDARAGSADHLAEPWAVPLQEARLSTFLAADQNNNTEAGEAENVFLSGQITDLQGRLNISNLADKGVVRPTGLAAFTRLFEVLGLPQDQLAQLAENVRFASDINVENRNAARAALQPHNVEQLAWFGLPPETIKALEPHVTLLPIVTPVNLNTATAEVLYAVIPKTSLADAQRLVAARESQHFRTSADVNALLPTGTTYPGTDVALGSQFFQVRGRIRMDTFVIEEVSIVRRNGLDVRVVQRERGIPQPVALR